MRQLLFLRPKSKNSEMTGYSTPDDAANALITAAKAGDQHALLAIFGPESKDLLYKGDPVQDKKWDLPISGRKARVPEHLRRVRAV